jgi:hypothetical protein
VFDQGFREYVTQFWHSLAFGCRDAGHVERGVERQTLEEAMDWVWKRQ